MEILVVIASYYIHLLPYISCSAYPVIFTLLNRRIKMARIYWCTLGFNSLSTMLIRHILIYFRLLVIVCYANCTKQVEN
uniref:Bm4635, isoform a n=1 Tax=Brugia malayi TaxID=6279 RepID=A0A1I9G8A1_BRUMA|nr:Bm4635, isoform a [Brugia malayi]